MKYKEEIYLIDQGEFPLSTTTLHAFANQHSVAKLADKRIEVKRNRGSGKDGEKEEEQEGGLLYVDGSRSHKLNANKI